jgi:hypothetical protein
MSNLLQSEAKGSTAVEHLPRHDHAWAVSANNGSVGKVLACAPRKKAACDHLDQLPPVAGALIADPVASSATVHSSHKEPLVPTIDTTHSYF